MIFKKSLLFFAAAAHVERQLRENLGPVPILKKINSMVLKR